MVLLRGPVLKRYVGPRRDAAHNRGRFLKVGKKLVTPTGIEPVFQP